MKTELVQSIFFLFALVLAAAAQESAPAFGGAKPPFLLLVALWTASRPDPLPEPGTSRGGRKIRHMGWLVVALAAGIFADSLDFLPFGCMITFTGFACAAVRFAREAMQSLPSVLTGFIIAATAAPCQEAWLNLWIPSGAESALVRFFASIPVAAASGAAIFAIAPYISKIIALDGDRPPERRG